MKHPVLGGGNSYLKALDRWEPAAGKSHKRGPKLEDGTQGGRKDLRAHSWGCCILLDLRGPWAPGLGKSSLSLRLAMDLTSTGCGPFWHQAFWKEGG